KYKMQQKLKVLIQSEFVKSLGDARNIGLVIFGIITLLVTWSGIKVVQTNYDVQKLIAAMQQQNDIKKLGNSNLELRNQYLETDQYLELAARRQYNKALPGEKLLIVPKAVALAHSAEMTIPGLEDVEVKTPEEEGPWYER